VGGREGVSEEFSTRLGGLLTLVKGCIVGAFVGLRLGLREGCALGVTETEGNWDGMADGIFVLLGGLVTAPIEMGLSEGSEDIVGCSENEGV